MSKLDDINKEIIIAKKLKALFTRWLKNKGIYMLYLTAYRNCNLTKVDKHWGVYFYIDHADIFILAENGDILTALFKHYIHFLVQQGRSSIYIDKLITYTIDYVKTYEKYGLSLEAQFQLNLEWGRFFNDNKKYIDTYIWSLYGKR